MTPEEKAKELIAKFSSIKEWVGGEGFVSVGHKIGKQCAIICVEQAITYNPLPTVPDDRSTKFHEYWKKVLEHIKNS